MNTDIETLEGYYNIIKELKEKRNGIKRNNNDGYYETSLNDLKIRNEKMIREFDLALELQNDYNELKVKTDQKICLYIIIVLLLMTLLFHAKMDAWGLASVIDFRLGIVGAQLVTFFVGSLDLFKNNFKKMDEIVSKFNSLSIMNHHDINIRDNNLKDKLVNIVKQNKIKYSNLLKEENDYKLQNVDYNNQIGIINSQLTYYYDLVNNLLIEINKKYPAIVVEDALLNMYAKDDSDIEKYVLTLKQNKNVD